MTDPATVAATIAYRRAMAALRRRGAGLVLAAFTAAEGVGDDALDAFTTVAAPRVAAIRSAAVSSTTGIVSTLVGEPVAVTVPARALALEAPFVTVRAALGRGVLYDQARELGARAAAGLGQEAAIRGQRDAMASADADARIVGWRRVPQGPTCSWCVLVSTQRYRTADSASFGHGHKGVDYCDCDIVPIVGDRDPGRVINRPTLDAWKAANEGDASPRYFDADTLDPVEAAGS